MTSSSFSGVVEKLFSSFPSQHARLLTMSTAQDSALPESMVVESFIGHEAINACFSFDIDALSISTELDLKQFLGEEITLNLLLGDGSRRAWHGFCTHAAWLGADGGLARYRLTLSPFLALLDLRHNNFIFQNKNAIDIVTQLLADYPQANFRVDVTQPLPVRPICTQYRESDFEFFVRVLARDGLSWRFEHQQDAASGDGPASHAKHQLVIFDIHAELPSLPGDAHVRFHRADATERSDSIDRFEAHRQVRPNAMTVASWNPSQVVAIAGEQSSGINAGELPKLDIFEGASEERYRNRAEAEQECDLRLKAFELGSKTFAGAGAVRALAAGYQFTLEQHHRYPAESNAFKVLAVRHAGRNNFVPGIDRPAAITGQMSNTPGSISNGPRGILANSAFYQHTPLTSNDYVLPELTQDAVADGTYRNTFACVRRDVAIVPTAATPGRRPTWAGPQIAHVVGVADAAITTQRDHRLRVQFPWQRGSAPLRGGLASGRRSTTDNAPGNEQSGTWVRVAEALAGPNWGTQFSPRIGDEVLIDFIDGNIDSPVVVAPLYGGNHTPPFAAGSDGSAGHAGTISGWHSRSLESAGGADGYNQWAIDDTTGQLRMRLASSTAASQCNLGYLVNQPIESARRGNYRGTGFELRTDAWGVVRGAEGMLVTTAARPRQRDGITSTQLDAAEAVKQLKAAQTLQETMTQAASHHHAQSSATAHTAHEAMLRVVDVAHPIDKLAKPVVVLDSAASINWASAASTLLYAGGNQQITTQQDWHGTAAHTASSVSGEATTLFAHTGGISAIAANGPVSLQAHTDALEILADQDVTVISVNDAIAIEANQKIVIQAGQSSITLEGADITFACPGVFSVKGSLHGFDGGASVAADIDKLPDTRTKLFDESFTIRDPNGNAMSSIAYTIKSTDGKLTSLSEIDGTTTRVSTEAADKLKFDLRWYEIDL